MNIYMNILSKYVFVCVFQIIFGSPLVFFFKYMKFKGMYN